MSGDMWWPSKQFSSLTQTEDELNYCEIIEKNMFWVKERLGTQLLLILMDFLYSSVSQSSLIERLREDFLYDIDFVFWQYRKTKSEFF